MHPHAGETVKELMVFGSGEFTPTYNLNKMYILIQKEALFMSLFKFFE
jgi:hypothetical protein